MTWSRENVNRSRRFVSSRKRPAIPPRPPATAMPGQCAPTFLIRRPARLQPNAARARKRTERECSRLTKTRGSARTRRENRPRSARNLRVSRRGDRLRRRREGSRIVHADTAVDQQRLPGDVSARVAGEEDERPRQVLDLAGPAERDLVGKVLHPFGVLIEDRGL